MSSETFFRSPREWVEKVIAHLEQALNIEIKSTYTRSPDELTSTKISYLVGEAEPVRSYSNDGRHIHDIELRFLIEVPTSMADFDLEALDASTRIDRELLNEFFGESDDCEEAIPVSNNPSRFQPELGVFARTVTMKQRIRMGPVNEVYGEIGGAELDGFNQESSGASE
ncbi:hypothetical protein [Vibrio anguillarum]|uniref:Uncharacterized protein n=2 Tax=Vibrio anguillarum TaxID=55601 RepID=A0ABD4QY42_VIBAN|nr:hypothetical protein [Vibrio anguillarum]ASG01544.1 hypothetical protein CEG15_15335 [Vibrio anguillarum]MBT2920164.1 hypothetical protein [Vibrio anguillarum]